MTLPGILDELFSSRFMPHGHCYLWTPGLVWLHAVSDGLIALAYTSIPFTLYVFSRRRRDIPFNWMFLFFATFIIACGLTHYLEIWTLWNGTYWLSGAIKALTALASVPTAILLVHLLPRALAIPHPAALHASEVRFRAALDGSLDAFFLIRARRDEAGHITDFVLVETNARGERLCDRERADMVDRSIAELLPPELARTVTSRYALVCETQETLGEEFQVASGGSTWWEHQLVPIEDGLAVTLRDITPRKSAERAVRDSEARVRALLEAAPDAMVIADGAGMIALVNARTEELFGWQRAELVDRPVRDLLPASSPGADPVVIRKDGVAVPVDINLSPMQAQGVRYTIATIRDITERNRAEKARARLAAIVESTDYAVYSRALDGKIDTWNAGAERLYGYTGAEIIGKPGAVLVPRHVADEIDEAGERRLERAETIRQRKGGGVVEVAVIVSPIKNGGILVGHAVVARDISDQKSAERQLKSSLREKEVLLKEVHHRVKNNLQVISSLLNLQAANISDPLALSMFRESQDRVRSIAFFHEHLYQSEDLARVDVAAYLKTLADNLLKSYAATRTGVTTTVRVDSDVRLGVDMAIPCGLIVNELVTNALKHGFRDGRPGTIAVDLRAASQRDLVLEVADDGVGLPPGYAIGTARTLGHQLVLTLVKQLNGRLTAENDKGARFEITFGRHLSGDHRAVDHHR